MFNKRKKYEEIERFLKKQMTKEEQEAFEKKINKSKSLREEVEAHRIVIAVEEDAITREFRERLSKVAKEYKETHLTPSQRKGGNNFLFFSIGMSLLLGISMLFYFQIDRSNSNLNDKNTTLTINSIKAFEE